MIKPFTHNLGAIHPLWWAILILLLLFPLPANDFFTLQIGAYSMILGIIALSLMTLAGYGGMISVAQLTVAGIAAYMVPIFGVNSNEVMGFGWNWWSVIPLALLIGTLASTLIGLIAVRTNGIYMIMITLAIAVSVFFFARQNYELFNGFTGYAGVGSPKIGETNINEPIPFYYLCLACSVLFVAMVVYASKAPFGLALQAIRDNERRVSALGYNVLAIRVYAFALSGFVASVGGVLLILLNGRISPGTIGVDVAIDILVIAVVGGLRHPIGPFLGALAFVLLENFAIDIIDRERFNTVIGIAFISIVLFSPDGLLGLWQKISGQIINQKASTKTNELGS